MENFDYERKYIPNIGDYLRDNFKKIDGFDYRWNSLITSKPLLFEDIDYLRCRDMVRNECTKEEIEAYKSGKLRVLYPTIETLLMLNLEYYDRIMCFMTMIFHHYVRLSDNQITKQHLNKLPFFFDITPTRIWCCAMTGLNSTEWELNYAWKYTRKNIIKIFDTDSLLKANYQYLYRNQIFARFVEYRALINGTSGFMNTLYVDKTSNHKLATVCSKFTHTSTALDESQLETLIQYIHEDRRSIDKLYLALKNTLQKVLKDFAIFCFATEFYIFTSKFKMVVSKDEDGKISKKYLSNNYECLVSEAYLSDTIKYQIEWARYQTPQEYNYDKEILIGLLTTMLKEDFKNIKCIRKMSDFKIYSEITFTGCFDNVYAIEKFWFNDTVVHETRKCFGKANMARYIVNRGYYIFGTIHDVDVLFLRDLTKQSLIEHYANYCIPINQHLDSIILEYIKNNNDIIDVLVTGDINPNRIEKSIGYTILQGNSVNSKEIMTSMKQIANNVQSTKKQSYWAAINS